MSDQVKKKIDFIGNSAAIRRVTELIEKVTNNDSTILLCGESGTGKEVVAKSIHYQGNRADKPFIPINCGAIPEALLESELFGHEKGAFTGANNIRLGRFELADGGTLFLDEISEMPYPLQVKLLRVLQELEFERVGGTKSIKVDVRIIAATNADLEVAVAEKRFRNDLFYRLNVIPITLPPLRKRREDIPLLMAHFLGRFNQKKQKQITGFLPEATNLFLTYPWPGNIRELENMVERVVILKDEGVITLEDLPEKITEGCQGLPLPELPVAIVAPDAPLISTETRASVPIVSDSFEMPDQGIPFTEWVEVYENRLIDGALKKANGVKSRAAQLLGLNRTTLVEKLKRRNNEKPSVTFTPQAEETDLASSATIEP